MTIDEKVTEIIDSFVSQGMTAGRVEYTDESTLVGDLGFDSLVFVTFVAAIEDSLGIVVPDEDFSIKRFATVGVVRAYIKAKM
ncbi:acyl carrier protein [Peterkaempfera griseoplana]|uniref:acyl carrier protein n=1 Tax=Peterkaempfera griseoplana TaxID=66896 RepID=UPI0006E2A322|nr:acyl carrier protein [Peterkaempfera griseoplana]